MPNPKKQAPRFVTPRLILKWPKLHQIDFGTNEYPKPDGEYSTRGVMQADDREVQAFLKKLQPLYDEAMAMAEEEFKKLKVETRKKLGGVKANSLFTTLYDQETEEPTGEIEMKFAMKASGTVQKGPRAGTVWKAKPDIFDAKGRPMVKVPEIWSGTIGKISFETNPYFIPGTGAAGLRLKLKGVQVIDLVAAGQRSASSYGFGEEEGYEYDDSQFTDESTGSEDTENPAGGDTNDEDNPDF